MLLLIPVAPSADSWPFPPRLEHGAVLPASPPPSSPLLLDAGPPPGGGAHLGLRMNLMPLCTALIAVITLGEPIHGYHLPGAA